MVKEKHFCDCALMGNLQEVRVDGGKARCVMKTGTKPCPTCYRPLINNAAEMRKALEKIASTTRERLNPPPQYRIDREILDVASAALAAPARNCDRFATVDEAAGAFITEDNPGGEPRMFVYEAIKWMLAPAPANTDEARHD